MTPRFMNQKIEERGREDERVNGKVKKRTDERDVEEKKSFVRIVIVIIERDDEGKRGDDVT